MSSKIKATDQIQIWIKPLLRQDTTADQIIDLFEVTLNMLWKGAGNMISSVMLKAVLERVFFNASENFPFLTLLEPGQEGVDFKKLRASSLKVNQKQWIDALHFSVVEFITILEKLTNGVISPKLYAELSKVTLDPKLKAILANVGD